MLFLAKRHPAGAEQRSSKEGCLSILGLLLAIALIGGLAALIYGRRNESRAFVFTSSLLWLRSGLVVHSQSATITGAIVFGVAVCFTVLLVLLIFYCLKQNPSTTSQQQQRRPHRQEMSHVQTSQTVNTVSHPPRYEQHVFSPSNVYPNLGEHTQTPAFSALNQSHSSANSHSLRDNRFD